MDCSDRKLVIDLEELEFIVEDIVMRFLGRNKVIWQVEKPGGLGSRDYYVGGATRGGGDDIRLVVFRILLLACQQTECQDRVCMFSLRTFSYPSAAQELYFVT